MFGVIENFTSLAGQIADGLGNHVEIFLQADAEHFGDVKIPSLADDRDDRGLGSEQSLDSKIIGRFHPATAGHSKSTNLRAF